MEQERIRFNIKYRPEIEAGEYLVQTMDGKPVRIICWDKRGDHSVVALIQYDEVELVGKYTKQGKIDMGGRKSGFDLFLISNPDYKGPITEFKPTAEPSASDKPLYGDWEAFRREAAKDFTAARLANPSYSSVSIGVSQGRVLQQLMNLLSN